MFVTALELINYRSYAQVSLPLQAGVNVFVGANGQGKTNLVEAVDYLASLRSHRVSSDVPLVQAGKTQAIIRANVQAGLHDSRKMLLELELLVGKSNKARLNKNQLPRTRDILGMLRTVVFSPEDLAVIKSDPAQRRRFLDELVILRWPRLAGVRSDYEKVLKQRTMLLKSMAGKGRFKSDPEADTTLTIWNEQLANLGAELLSARIDTLSDLIPFATQAYQDIAPSNNKISAQYQATIDLPEHNNFDNLRDGLLVAMDSKRIEEINRGISLVGPHRDDVLFKLGTLPAKGYASHGETWSYALALRLGAFQLLRSDGVEPVLILDDVFAELDSTRRVRLAQQISTAEQVLITAAVAEDIPDLLQGKHYRVNSGQVEYD